MRLKPYYLIILLFFLIIFTLFKYITIRYNNYLQTAPTPTPKGNISLKSMLTKMHKTDILPIMFDVNAYLKSKNRPTIPQSDITKIKNTDLLRMLNNNDESIVIDIREKREIEQLIRLHPYKNLRYIRFGDIINNKFEPIPKDKEIVLVSFIENRETIASFYLKSQGYKNVKILEGGLFQWSFDKLPLALNDYLGTNKNHKSIVSILNKNTGEEIRSLNPQPKILTFGTFSSSTTAMFLWDSKTLKTYISNLPKEKKYILECNFDSYCWEATYFWYEAKDSIDIIGYKSET